MSEQPVTVLLEVYGIFDESLQLGKPGLGFSTRDRSLKQLVPLTLLDDLPDVLLKGEVINLTMPHWLAAKKNFI